MDVGSMGMSAGSAGPMGTQAAVGAMRVPQPGIGEKVERSFRFTMIYIYVHSGDRTSP